MAAKYDFRPNPNPKGNDEQQPLHPRIVVSGTKETKDIVREVAKYTGFSQGDVAGVLISLEEYLIRHLSDGYNVKLGNIGTFSASLRSRKVMDRKEIRSVSIHFDNVNFKAAPDLVKGIRQAEDLERAEYGFGASSKKYAKEERQALLLKYLEEHPFISRQEYSELTGLLRTKATRELKEWAAAKIIQRHGRVPHVVYSAVNASPLTDRTANDEETI